MLTKFGVLAFSTFFILSSLSVSHAAGAVKTKRAKQVPIVIIGHGEFNAPRGSKPDALVIQAKTAEGYVVNNETCKLWAIQSLPKTILKAPVVHRAIDERLKETVYAKHHGKMVKRINPTFVTIRYGKNQNDYLGSFKMTLTDYQSSNKAKILYFTSNTMTNLKGDKLQLGKEYFFSACVDNPPIEFPLKIRTIDRLHNGTN